MENTENNMTERGTLNPQDERENAYIQDPVVAQNLANIQYHQGAEVAAIREQYLTGEQEVEYNEQENINIALVEELSDKFPKAFDERILADGSKCLVFATDRPLGQFNESDIPEELAEAIALLDEKNLFARKQVSILSKFGVTQISSEDDKYNNSTNESRLKGLILEEKKFREIMDNIPQAQNKEPADTTTIFTTNLLGKHIGVTTSRKMQDYISENKTIYGAIFRILEKNGQIRENYRDLARTLVSKL